MTAANIIHFVASRPAVSSLVIAEEFGRRHTHVLRTIDSLVADGTITQPEFGLSEYTDNSGRKNKCYDLYEDAFLIAMPFIGGKKARQGQRRLVKEFGKVRRKAERRASLEWQQARLEGKDARHHETDTIAAFVEYASALGSKNARHYYVDLTKMTYKALFLVEQGLKTPNRLRDLLTGMQLSFLSTAEYVCANALKEGMDRDLPYKDIYVLARDRVQVYAASIGRTRALAA